MVEAQVYDGGTSMMWNRLGMMALTLLALASGGQLVAQEEKGQPGQRHPLLEALASKLGLSDQQKEEIRKIHADYDKKMRPLEEQLWTLHHAEHEAMSKVLTEEQRTKLPEAMKAVMHKEMEKMADKLGLTEAQKQKCEKIHEMYEKKFHDLASQKSEDARHKFHALRAEAMAAVGKELNDEQRAKLPATMREEFHRMHDPSVRREHLKAFADKLGLSAEQKEQVQKIHNEYEQKIEKPVDQLKQMHKDEHEAVEKVLTQEQRTKLRELLKSRGRGE